MFSKKDCMVTKNGKQVAKEGDEKQEGERGWLRSGDGWLSMGGDK